MFIAKLSIGNLGLCIVFLLDCMFPKLWTCLKIRHTLVILSRFKYSIGIREPGGDLNKSVGTRNSFHPSPLCT